MRLSTLFVTLVAVIFLAILNKFNLTLMAFFIVLRETIAGSKKDRFSYEDISWCS
ncbi:hypothetical protein [Piscirickettsia litoralis]|uniref:hypothetical protein n=1 Tax=Piscirickettsia litoralis TaxID=1891921 RepID=UPI002938CF5B|nr:hypothetical protein [Piscirickettsia litoralis]